MSTEKLKNTIRDVPNFPKDGITFKDITPILLNPELTKSVVTSMAKQVKELQLDAIVGIESRGFWFGIMLANMLKIPFIPIRKKGKLPYKTVSYKYELEYGNAEIEMHKDALKPDWKVLVHDDLLATGGTAVAAAELIKMQNAQVAGFSFVVNLDFLNGKEQLRPYSSNITSLIEY